MNQSKLKIFNQFVNSIPAVQMKNPYWSFNEDNEYIISHLSDIPSKFNIRQWFNILNDVKIYFKHVFNSFHSEAQVLCVSKGDGKKLDALQIPKLPNTYQIGNEEILIYVLPQKNSYHLTSVCDDFWQKHIIGQNIHPIARIHSHHELDPYQSPTDYATLNSNSLELVIGKINADTLSIGFWLDQRGKLTKEIVWTYEEATTSQTRIKCGKMGTTDIKKKQKKEENK